MSITSLLVEGLRPSPVLRNAVPRSTPLPTEQLFPVGWMTEHDVEWRVFLSGGDLVTFDDPGSDGLALVLGSVTVFEDAYTRAMVRRAGVFVPLGDYNQPRCLEEDCRASEDDVDEPIVGLCSSCTEDGARVCPECRAVVWDNSTGCAACGCWL